MYQKKGSAFSYLKPLSEFRHMVHFKDRPRGKAEAGDRTVLGLDVGSTTTKGVIMRCRDKAILAADYLRTDGDPVAASRKVYQQPGRSDRRADKHRRIGSYRIRPANRRPPCHDRRSDQRDHSTCRRGRAF